jgi:RNA polymerase sigma-70 factor, ECF subfamily
VSRGGDLASAATALLPALDRYARSLTRDPVAAEDLVQDTLAAALARRERYDPRRPLRQWLFAIMHNRFVDDRRREQVARSSIAGPVLPPELAGQELAAELTLVAAAVERLPLEQREALHLVVVEGMSYAEAAATLAVPIGTVMSRLARARARLREEPRDVAAVRQQFRIV